MALSWLYSYYVNHFSHYSVLYGSIGAVIVVLIWLNLSARHIDSGCGDERCAHQYAEGPSGAGRQHTQDINRLSNLSRGLAAGKEAVLWIAKLQEYAKLLIEVGLNVQKGQTLIISSPVECASFARLCADAAYDAGCREVIMNWSDDYLSRHEVPPGGRLRF